MNAKPARIVLHPASDKARSNKSAERIFAAELLGSDGKVVVVHRGREYLLSLSSDGNELVLKQ